jgi:tetratricopeptide (TPR) repeat protein
MDGLVIRMKTSSGTGLGVSVAQKIAMITTTPNVAMAGIRGSAVMGVRGDPEKYGIPRDVMWPDSLDVIETLLNEKKYGLAEERLIRELRNPGELKLLFEFRLAEAYLGQGKTARAWKLISSMTPDMSLGCYNDFLILKSQLQADALEYVDSLATIAPLLEPLAQNGYGQFACLIAYHDLKNLGRTEEASDIRARGIAIDPASEAAKMLSSKR